MILKNICRLCMFLVSLSSTILLAQQSSFSQLQIRMQEQGIQSLLTQLKPIQECIGTIDPSKLSAIKSKAAITKQNIEQYCAANNEQKAKDEGLAFAKEMQASPSLVELEHCLKDLPSMLRGQLQTMDLDQLKKSFDSESVCEKIP